MGKVMRQYNAVMLIFKQILHLSPRYSPKNIVSNLLLKIKKDIVKYHPQFDIKIVKSSENQIRGFSIAW